MKDNNKKFDRFIKLINKYALEITTKIDLFEAREILELDLSLENQKRLDESCEILSEYMDQIREKVL